MLKVDLGQLARSRRLQIDASVPPDHALFREAAFDMRGPLDVRLEALQAGDDVVVRGSLRGEALLACRRCLVDVGVAVDEEVALVFRPGVSEADAEDAEVYPLPEKGGELDLTRALREQLVLAVPEFALCSEACKGLCATCGANLNETTCSCETEQVDERWAALLKARDAAQD